MTAREPIHQGTAVLVPGLYLWESGTGHRVEVGDADGADVLVLADVVTMAEVRQVISRLRLLARPGPHDDWGTAHIEAFAQADDVLTRLGERT
jgi:hypothetical protein